MLRSMAIGLLLTASVSAGAQNDIFSGIKKAVTTSVAKTSSSIKKTLTSVIGNSVVTTQQLIGTWNYSSPAVIFESDNLLKQAGGTIVASGIEKKWQAYLTQYGITPGKMAISFKKDNTFTCTSGSNSINGTYKLSNTNLTLSYKIEGTTAPTSVTARAGMKNNNLQICFESTKLLTFLSAVGAESDSTAVASLTKLASSYNGIQLGMKFSKKQ